VAVLGFADAYRVRIRAQLKYKLLSASVLYPMLISWYSWDQTESFDLVIIVLARLHLMSAYHLLTILGWSDDGWHIMEMVNLQSHIKFRDWRLFH